MHAAGLKPFIVAPGRSGACDHVPATVSKTFTVRCTLSLASMPPSTKMRVPCVVAMRARRENGCGRRVHAGDAAARSSARTVVAHVLSPPRLVPDIDQPPTT